MNGLDAVATAIMWHEGPFRPVNRNFRNCNPGNLRAANAPAHDAGGFGIYPTVVVGYEALCDDLAAKFTDGKNSHGLGQNSTLADLMLTYAPAQDFNNPASYAAFVAEWVGLATGKPITVQTKLGEIWTPPPSDARGTEST